MPWWANLAWCGVFVLLLQPERLKLGVGLAAGGVLLRLIAVASSVGTLWMLSGFGWLAVMAFYATTALWPVLLWLLLRRPEKAGVFAGWMIPVAAVEGVGSLGQVAGMLTGALLGSPRFDLQVVSAAAFAVGQVTFLVLKMRTA
ncbi:MAG: hypothetical protein ABIR70_13770 [Bryobacteraceae bacterium]